MAADYAFIREDNRLKYGTEIGRIGRMLLADRYSDRTHFIYELLQNAEDALARRSCSESSRAVSFQLTDEVLRVRHFGEPFNEADVRGVCGIAESTKELTAIGRFGIGFKSVYAFTDRPEVHSGEEHFAIENYVWPAPAEPVEQDPGETDIILPLRTPENSDHQDIARGLQKLGPRALLFLREIDEIAWHVEGGSSGIYLRDEPDWLEENVRRVTVIGQVEEGADIDETWLVFSRPVADGDSGTGGNVELAFSLEQDEKMAHESIRQLRTSKLVVFFPTVLETHLGFLVQGPYRTTPSRDNVPPADPWNQRCVKETASLLVHALRWLRDHEYLDTGALQCLPLDRTKFAEGNMFASLFEVTKEALSCEPLLPRFDGGYAAAATARLARVKELRDLFDPSQLALLFGSEGELTWLSGAITQDRTPKLREYLTRELDIDLVTPETILRRLDVAFLEAQSDEWILALYEFLNCQPALRYRSRIQPLIRLKDGTHVVSLVDDQPQAFLPTTSETGFPTVRGAVCASAEAQQFLESLELTRPNLVDDVVRNVLPRYRRDAGLEQSQYASDIQRILKAFKTDSKDQKEKLLVALRASSFLRAVKTGDGSKCMSKAQDLYLATERLRALFSGVNEVLLVDDDSECLRGDDARELLEACGVVRYLRPVADTSLSADEKRELRTKSGHAETSWQNDRVTDWTLQGLRQFLDVLPRLEHEERQARARLLWEELSNLEERRGKGVFTGVYRWTHYGKYQSEFPAAFIRRLKKTAWIPSDDGQLEQPEMVSFESLGWKANPFLESKIRFKPPIIDQLAEEAGIEAGVLELLKKHGMTSVAELITRLNLQDEPRQDEDSGPKTADEAIQSILGDAARPTPPVPGSTSPEPARPTSGKGGNSSAPGGGPRNRTHGNGGRRVFISYVAVHPGEDEPDADRLDTSIRLALEERAIDLILAREPSWRRTPMHNPGYDLFELGDGGKATRWCEVKAMAGSLHDRPVGLSHTQFECAQEHGAAYWLYVVEHAAGEDSRIVRIQDPAGKARTFTFDHGWTNIADVDTAREDRKG